MGIYAHSGDTCIDSDFIICPMNARRSNLIQFRSSEQFCFMEASLFLRRILLSWKLNIISFPYQVSYDATKSTGNWELTQDEIATVT